MMSASTGRAFRIISLSINFCYINYLGSTSKSCRFSPAACSCTCSLLFQRNISTKPSVQLVLQLHSALRYWERYNKHTRFHWYAPTEITSYVYKNKLRYPTLQKPRANMRTADLEMRFLTATPSCSGCPELYSMCVCVYVCVCVETFCIAACSSVGMFSH
jgi:hypothetical protein